VLVPELFYLVAVAGGQQAVPLSVVLLVIN
jgi:hypothetical protein